MATLTAQDVTRNGLEPTMAAASAGGDQFTNTGREWLEIVNGGGSDVTLTIPTTVTVDGQAVADRTITVTAGERRLVGPFTSQYEDGDRVVSLAYSGVTSVTVGLFKLS